jgi:hypothetical protein
MAKAAVVFTQDNEYYTPANIVNYFGRFDYDPATTKEKADEFGLLAYDDITTNGLDQDWTIYKRIWINPPFTIKHLFLAKAWNTYQKTLNEIYMLFPIEFLTTQRFHKIGATGKLFIPNGRIKFESGLGKPAKSPAFGCVIIKLSNEFSIELIKI